MVKIKYIVIIWLIFSPVWATNSCIDSNNILIAYASLPNNNLANLDALKKVIKFVDMKYRYLELDERLTSGVKISAKLFIDKNKKPTIFEIKDHPTFQEISLFSCVNNQWQDLTVQKLIEIKDLTKRKSLEYKAYKKKHITINGQILTKEDIQLIPVPIIHYRLSKIDNKIWGYATHPSLLLSINKEPIDLFYIKFSAGKFKRSYKF